MKRRDRSVSSSTRRFARRWTACLLISLGVVGTAGCGIFGSTESLLEKGESVETGRKPFDTYFDRVGEYRDEVAKLDSDLFEVRERLVEELGVSVDIGLGELLQKTKEKVDKLKGFGMQLDLRLKPKPEVVVEHGNLEADAKDETMVMAIQQSAERAMDAFVKYSQLLELGAQLDRERAELAEGIDRLPPQYADKKDLIETEIVAAGRIIKNAERKLLRDTRTLSHFLLGLANSVESGALEAHTTKCAEAIAFYEENKKKPKKPPPKWSPRPGGGQGKPPPRPAGGDFEM